MKLLDLELLVLHESLVESLVEGETVEPEKPFFAKQRLQSFLISNNITEIIADWPEDVHHICKFMITGPGIMILTPTKINFIVDRSIEGVSKLPHHALFDAIGNMEFSLSREYMETQNS